MTHDEHVTRTDIAGYALGKMEGILGLFDESELYRRFESEPRWEEDDSRYFTETTPFFSDVSSSGEVAVQRLNAETKIRQRKNGFLGKVGLKETITFAAPLHYALIVVDGGVGQKREYARVHNGRPSDDDNLIRYAARWPLDIALREGTLEEDRETLAVLDEIYTSRCLGEQTLGRQGEIMSASELFRKAAPKQFFA